MQQQQMVCEACGTGRTQAAGFEFKVCPFCATKHLRQMSFDAHAYHPDSIAPIQVTPKAAARIIEHQLEPFAKRNRFNPNRCEMTLRTPLYVPLWHFDMAIDPDGKGPSKPITERIRRHALTGPARPIAQQLLDFSGDFVPFKPEHIDQVPMVAPNIPYQEVSKQVLLGVQDDLKDQSFSPIRQSGIIGEVGMVTQLQLIPVWLAAYITTHHRHYLIINGVSGNTTPMRPLDR